MAEFVRATGHAATPLAHDPKYFRDSVLRSVVGGMMGKAGSGSPIIVDTELQATAGDNKRYHLTPFLDINPITGQDAAIKGNESNVSEAVFDVAIDEVNFALKKKGRMSDQRTIMNVRNEHRTQIANLFMQYNNDEVFRQLSGQSLTDTDAIDDEANRVNGPNRCFRMTGTSGASAVLEDDSDATSLDGLMSTTDKMNLLGIEEIVSKIQQKPTSGYRMNSIAAIDRDDMEKYILWVSPEQATQLRRDPDWQNEHLSLIEAGLGNAFAEGFVGMYNNVIVRRTHRIQTFAVDGGDRYARALLVGADALVCAWASTLQYTDDTDDYGRELGTDGWEIRGTTKVRMALDPETDTQGAGAAASGTEDQDLGVAQIISAAATL